VLLLVRRVSPIFRWTIAAVGKYGKDATLSADHQFESAAANKAVEQP